MKCPKCRKETRKVQDGANRFAWVCPNCGKRIGFAEKLEVKDGNTKKEDAVAS